MGGLLSLSPANPAFSLISFPHPPDPLPLRGRGRFFSLFCRGLRPRPPGIKPPAALIVPAEQVPKGGLPLRGTGYPRRCGKRNGGLNPGGTGYPRRCGKRIGGLNPGGTGYPRRCSARRGACPRRHWLSPPLWKTHWGAYLLCCQPPPPLAFFSAPIPPPPFPSGEGGDFLFSYARGFAPCIPATEPEAALAIPATVENAMGGLPPRGTGSTCKAGKRRGEARGFSAKTKGDGSLWAKPAAKERGDRGRWNYPSLTRRRRLRWSSPPGQGEPVPPGFSPGDARGEAPCIK